MDIIPIQSLPPVRRAAPSASSVEFATTRAVEFHPHDQSGQQDATYTPGGRENEMESGQQHGQQAAAQVESAAAENPDAPDAPESTISVFA